MAKRLSEDELKWILSIDATEAQQSIRALSKDNNKLNASNKELKERMISLIATGKKESEEYKNLSAEVALNNGRIDHNKAKIKSLEGTLGLTALTMAQLRKQARDLQRQLDNTSQATHPEEWNKLGTNLREVRERMDELKTSGQKTEETLGDTILSKGTLATFFGNMYTKAVDWATEAIGKAREFVSEGVRMAGMAEGIERAFNRISAPGLMDELRRSTKGMVNDLQLMQSTVRADYFKIPLSELGTLLRFAQQRAQETGESVEYLTDSIVTGIGRQSPLILDNLGISAKRLGEEVSKTGDFAKAVGVIVREELSKSGETIDTAADKAQQRAVLLQNIQMSIGQRIIGIVESTGSAWTSFLGVINRWVNIPTVEKLRDEQRETNILAHSILAAEGRTEARNLLIQEMQRQYPSFLSNLDAEKLTNEQLAERLREVNGEYENRLRVQIMNDKTLQPLNDKQRNLIEEEIESIQTLSRLTETWGDKMSDSFKQAITSGDVLKMSSEDIRKEINAMNLGSRRGVGLVISSNIDRLKKIPSELKAVEKEIKDTTTRISSFGGGEAPKTDPPATAPQGLMEQYEEQRKKLLEDRLKATEETVIKEKNIEIKALDEKIAKLQEYGVEKKRENDSETKNALDLNLRKQENAHTAELTILRETRIKESQSESFYNLQRLSSDTKFYQDRLKLLHDYQKKSTDPKLQEEITKNINDTQASILDTQVRRDEETIRVLKDNRDKRLKVEEASYKTQQTVFEKELVTKQITQQQYDLLTLSAEVATTESRLRINQDYQSDVESLELASGSVKAQAVEEANQAVMEADLRASKARSSQLREFQKAASAVSDFKSEFKLLKPEEETKLQLAALKASYEASRELARGDAAALAELDIAYERAKTQILQQEEDKRNQIRSQYGLLSMRDQYDLEMEQLKKQYDQGLLDEEEYQKAKNQIKVKYLKDSFDYYSNLFSGAINALQQAELDNIDAKYDAEIQRAGDNTEEVARLEKEKEAKKLEVQKKYAGVQFAIKVSEIIANTAVAIMQAFAQLGPIGGAITAAMLGVTSIAQIATANAERKKVMNMTVDNAGSGSSGGTGSRVVTGKQSGGYMDVTREQDGKKFHAAVDPDKRGFIDKPTVIVGEGPAGNSQEWVASNAALQNPTVRPFINVLNEAQEKGEIRTVDMNQMMRKRLAGLESGGPIGRTKETVPPIAQSPRPGNTPKNDDIDMNLLKKILQKLDNLRAYVVYSDIEKARDTLDKSKKIGGK